MSEFIANAEQTVLLNQPAIFDASIPCRKGYVYHEDGTGIFTLRGITQNCFARYQVTFNGNIALPSTGTPGPIAVALAVNGETRPTSRAVVTPSAVEEYFNVTSTATITVPRGCCFSLSLRAVTAADEGAPALLLENANLDITRIA